MGKKQDKSTKVTIKSEAAVAKFHVWKDFRAILRETFEKLQVMVTAYFRQYGQFCFVSEVWKFHVRTAEQNSVGGES